MAEETKTVEGIADRLRLVREFLADLYSGWPPQKDRIAFVSNTLDGVIAEMEAESDSR